MSWITDDGQHEGWVAARFPGGLVGCGSGHGGALAVPEAPDGTRDYDAQTVVDGRTALSWHGRCDGCGWRGPGHQAQPGQADQRGDPPAGLEETIYREWCAHLPAPVLAEIGELAAQITLMTDRLAVTVAHARAAGITWAAIGDAAGMTKQSAQGRWGKQVAILADGFPELRSARAGAD